MPANGIRENHRIHSTTSQNSTIAEHMRLSRTRNMTNNNTNNNNQPPPVINAIPPSAQKVTSLIQSTICKSSISSLFLSTFNNTTTPNPNKKKNAPSIRKAASAFGGLGCSATSSSPEVSVPAIIRNSADWQTKIHRQNKKKKLKQKQQQKKKVSSRRSILMDPPPLASTDVAAAESISRRNHVNSRGKIDGGERNMQRERCSRRATNLDNIADIDFDSAFGLAHSGSDIFQDRCRHQVRNRSPEGLAELLILQTSLLMGGRLNTLDQFRHWRLDIDHMTYEQLLALGDKIGYVNTGLRKDEISLCIKKLKFPENNSSRRENVVSKCSICQEEFEANEEMGELICGHAYHTDCIKQWLRQKKTCPMCKSEVLAKQ